MIKTESFFPGNLLTIIVLKNFDHKSPFNTLLIMLVSMDSLVLLFSLFDSYLSGFGYPEPLWYKVLFPKLWHPLKNVALSGCIYMVVAVAAERYENIRNFKVESNVP